MKTLVIFLLFTGLLLGLGYLIYTDPSSILVHYHQWEIESNFWLFLVGLGVVYWIITLLIRIIRAIFNLPDLLQQWRISQKRREANQQTQQGLALLLSGQWAKAEKTLTLAARNSGVPLINFLLTAYSASRQKKKEAFEEYCQQAQRCLPSNATAAIILIAKAHMEIMQGDYQAALQSLQSLSEKDSTAPEVVELKVKAYAEIGEWLKAAQYLPTLRDQKSLSDRDMQRLEEKIYPLSFKNSSSVEDLKKTWEELSKICQHNPRLLHAYCHTLIQQGHSETASSLLKKTLKEQWDSELVLLYSQATVDHLDDQLSQAKSWLKAHPGDYALLYHLGSLSFQQELYGQAKLHLEASITRKPTAEAFSALAKVYEKEGALHKALHYCQKGMELLTENP